MRGLPDSVVYGTYRRLTRKGRKADKGNTYYKGQADLLNTWIAKLLAKVVR